VIVGANAAGKSNLFDALRFLSRLADADIRTALQDLRGEPHELFRLGANGAAASAMKFAIEVLLDPSVKDPYGQRKERANTRIRYEVHIEQRTVATTGLEKLFISHERASPILKSLSIPDLQHPSTASPIMVRPIRDFGWPYSRRTH
jgi:predicted ATPase